MGFSLSHTPNHQPTVLTGSNIATKPHQGWRPMRQFRPRKPHRRPATFHDPEDLPVIRELTAELTRRFRPHLSEACTHPAGHGGRAASIRGFSAAIRSGTHRFVFRTDVLCYYENIDPDILFDAVKIRVPEPHLRSQVYHWIHRCVCRDGIYRRVDRGIPLGSPLSPLMAALYLDPLDRAFEPLSARGVYYRRFMDDIVVLAPNRNLLRRAIRTVNQHFTRLKLARHPDKTFIGKLSRGFDALGSRFEMSVGLVGPSRPAVERFATQVFERYAQHGGGAALRTYVNRWLGAQTFGIPVGIPPETQPPPHQHHETHAIPPPPPCCP